MLKDWYIKKEDIVSLWSFFHVYILVLITVVLKELYVWLQLPFLIVTCDLHLLDQSSVHTSHGHSF